MKIKSATIKNYRVHREINVEFDPKLTLISGLNESGKSTLAEAIHRALFFRAKAGGSVRESMNSSWGAPPQVELAFDAASKKIVLAKSFISGARGECTLHVAGEGALTGDAAEDRLAQLLGSGEPIGGQGAEGALAKRWAHLWVWQGNAGSSPTETVTEQKDTLVQRLQSRGGAAVAQSDVDARVLRDICGRRDAIFTSNQKTIKTNTDLARIEQELAAAQKSFQEKQQIVEALEDAVTRHTRASDEIEAKSRALETSSRELQVTEEGVRRAEQLTRTMEPVARRQTEAVARIAALDKIATDLAKARQEHDHETAALSPQEAKAAKHRQEQETCHTALRKAETRLTKARNDETEARLWRSALEAQLQALEKRLTLDVLTHDQQAIALKRVEQQTLRDELARIPQVTPKDVTALQGLQRKLAVAEATHAALGARVEIVASSEPVQVNGAPLALGDSQVVTDDAEIAIGSIATLRIKPGGTTGIAEARQALETICGKLATSLQRLGVDTVEEAIAADEKRRRLDTQDSSLQKDLERLKADENDEAVRACKLAHTTAAHRAESAAAKCGRPLPSDLVAARALAEEAETVHRGVERVLTTAESALTAARERYDEAEALATTARLDMEQVRRRAQDAEIRVRTIEEQHGSDACRADTLLALRTQREQADAEQQTLQRELDTLQPEQLRIDMERLRRAVRQTQDAINTAEQDKAGAAERLHLSGTSDPREDLEKVRAAVERADSRRQELRNHAEAVQHLAAVMEDVQRGITERINKPLEDAAQGYLACVFGAGTRIKFSGGLQADKLPAITVDREQAGFGTFGFEELSGGTREQVGIAMRLAMAEVLAAEHDGCLPIVLDDAFANSDPERVRALQRMLYRAADRGLQIIVLTCTPEGYSTLGATEVRLERISRQGDA